MSIHLLRLSTSRPLDKMHIEASPHEHAQNCDLVASLVVATSVKTPQLKGSRVLQPIKTAMLLHPRKMDGLRALRGGSAPSWLSDSLPAFLRHSSCANLFDSMPSSMLNFLR